MLKDDPLFAKYFKMLKMHLPPPAVKQKMRTEGVDPDILDMDPEGPSPNQPVVLGSDGKATKQTPAEMRAKLAAVEAKAKAEEKARAEAAAKAKAAKAAKARAVWRGPKPSIPTKAVYVDKVPDAWVDATLFGGVYDVLLDSIKVKPSPSANHRHRASTREPPRACLTLRLCAPPSPRDAMCVCP